jgi:ankyrin repeat protein
MATAAVSASLAQVENRGPNVSPPAVQGEDKVTALFTAFMRENHIEVARLICKERANPNSKNAYGDTLQVVNAGTINPGMEEKTLIHKARELYALGATDMGVKKSQGRTPDERLVEAAAKNEAHRIALICENYELAKYLENPVSLKY